MAFRPQREQSASGPQRPQSITGRAQCQTPGASAKSDTNPRTVVVQTGMGPYQFKPGQTVQSQEDQETYGGRVSDFYKSAQSVSLRTLNPD